jgi:small subunit ribosomal protein S9
MADERDDLPQEPESGAPEEEARETEAVGPEIEGMEDLVAQTGGEAEEPAAEEPAAQEAAEGEPAPEAAADEPAAEGEPAADEPAAEEPVAEGAGAAEGGAAEEPAAEGEPAAEEPAAVEPVAEGAAAAEEGAAEEPAAEEPVAEGEPAADEAAAGDRPPRERRPRRDRRQDEPEEEVIPGMHLEPDLVLEEAPREESEFGQYGEAEDYEGAEAAEDEAGEAPAEPEPVVHTPLDLAADARYNATGKRKSAVARVILKPGEGTYSVNGRHLDEYFPRVRLQRMARQPLEAAGYQTRMDVVARIHGGGVAAQATALRHGIARALVEADPALRGELKRRGYLTRDPRVKERKKAGLKKARKRPQFSKR